MKLEDLKLTRAVTYVKDGHYRLPLKTRYVYEVSSGDDILKTILVIGEHKMERLEAAYTGILKFIEKKFGIVATRSDFR